MDDHRIIDGIQDLLLILPIVIPDPFRQITMLEVILNGKRYLLLTKDHIQHVLIPYDNLALVSPHIFQEITLHIQFPPIL
jgi:hypothetical protein